MIRNLLISILLFCAVGSMNEAYSQSWLEHVGRTAAKRAKNRAVQKAEEKVYETVDKAVDKAFEETEKAVTNTANKIAESAEANKAAADSVKAAQAAEKKAAEQARLQREAEARKQKVMEQFAGRPASKDAPFYIAKPGVTITFASKNAKGKTESYSTSTIVNVEYKDSRNFSVESISEVFTDKMEPLLSTPMSSKVNVSDGVVTLDPSSMAGKMMEGMEISGDFFFVPDNIMVGDILMDYSITISIAGLKTTSENTDIRVSARETLEISGHSIDCYVIESKVLTKAMGIKAEMSQKVWYGRGIGQVKTESYDSKGKLQAINEMVGIKGL